MGAQLVAWDRITPLQRRLSAGGAPLRRTPIDAFELARRALLAGERVDMGKLAVPVDDLARAAIQIIEACIRARVTPGAAPDVARAERMLQVLLDVHRPRHLAEEG